MQRRKCGKSHLVMPNNLKFMASKPSIYSCDNRSLKCCFNSENFKSLKMKRESFCLSVVSK